MAHKPAEAVPHHNALSKRPTKDKVRSVVAHRETNEDQEPHHQQAEVGGNAYDVLMDNLGAILDEAERAASRQHRRHKPSAAQLKARPSRMLQRTKVSTA